MKKPKEFEVETLKDFQELMESKHFSIAKAIVESILNNIKLIKNSELSVTNIAKNIESHVYNLNILKSLER